MKEDENRASARAVALQLMKVTVLAESSVFILFNRDQSAPAMSTDMSQVGFSFLHFNIFFMVNEMFQLHRGD